ncbi:MAG TPA: nucleotidyltransferase family protein [Bryobacteraceae bacterium]|jgi:molybdenum cofactor cytidylyltransferase|nr:nucleotidyltransferase family protein [Bryobacteraceae bacterium]
MHAAIILAAGAATRMGEAKQLLPFGHTTLIQHAIEQAVGAGFDRVAVVVGAHAQEIQEAIADLSVDVVRNEAWETGMGSSLVAGLQHILTSGSNPDYIAILLADQPLVRAEHLAAMRRLADQSQSPIVAARYGGTLGVPAFFKRTLFPDLEALPPTTGARHLLKLPGQKIVVFDLPEAAVDIDTPEDFQALSSSP